MHGLWHISLCMCKGKDSREDSTVLSSLVLWMEAVEETLAIKVGRYILNSFIRHVKRTELHPEQEKT